MKLTSNNVTLIVNEKMDMATITVNGREPMFIPFEQLDEVRDLLVDYFQMTN